MSYDTNLDVKYGKMASVVKYDKSVLKGRVGVVDRNEFFREATLRICSHLDIERSMSACLSYLSEVLPADVMFLDLLEPKLKAIRTIARVTPKEVTTMDLLTPLPKNIDLQKWKARDVWVVNRTDDPVSQTMVKRFSIEGCSLVLLFLKLEGKNLGKLVLSAKGLDRYTEEHAELLKLLNEPFAIALSNSLKHREVQRLTDILADENKCLQQDLLRQVGEEVVGASFGLASVMEHVRHVAPVKSPVLILGETGVGKDVIANAIHRYSGRQGALIKVNCGAIAPALIDSELFGHEKGAFTGALSRKRGRFERAHGGTIFLDEIGDLPLEAQVRLLRVLQFGEIERVGGSESIPLNIRVIAATHRKLDEMVKEGTFREDLWFRLNVFPINIPSLRERTCDIPALVHHFINKKSRELKLKSRPSLAEGAIEQLLAYGWPGNVRELENVVERAIILCRDGSLHFNLGEQPRTAAAEISVKQLPDGPFPALDAVIAQHILAALKKTEGKIHGVGGAGELLEVNPNTLRHRMRKLGIAFGRSHYRKAPLK